MGQEVFVPSDEETEEPGEETGDVADADLVAAAEAALKGAEKPEAKELEPERDEHGRFIRQEAKPKAKAQEKPAAEKPSSVIARELAKREAARQEESAYKSKAAELEKVSGQLQSFQEQLQQQAAELARERQELLAARRDPAAFMKTVGWTADQFIDSATRAKDPAYQEAIALREELSKRDTVLDEVRSELKALKAKAQSYDDATKAAQSQQELQEFWTSIPKDSPAWQDYEDQDDMVYFAKKVRQKYYDATGRVASPKQIGEYLHYKALERRAGASAPTAEQKPNAGKTKAKVPRALGGTEASERRAGGNAKHIHDMNPDEERAYLMDVASNAIAGGGD